MKMIEFDHIIIGSGAVGSTLAHYLSKDPEIKIAIVDIGLLEPKKPRRFKAPFVENSTKCYTHFISAFGGNTEL